MDRPFWALIFLFSFTFTAALADDPASVSKGWGDVAPAPSENECRSFIEAALKEQRTQAEAVTEAEDRTGDGGTISVDENTDAANQVIQETTDEASTEDKESGEDADTTVEDLKESAEVSAEEVVDTSEAEPEETGAESAEASTESAEAGAESAEAGGESAEAGVESAEAGGAESAEAGAESAEAGAESSEAGTESVEAGAESTEVDDSKEDKTGDNDSIEETGESEAADKETDASGESENELATEEIVADENESIEKDVETDSTENVKTEAESNEETDASVEAEEQSSTEQENVSVEVEQSEQPVDQNPASLESEEVEGAAVSTENVDAIGGDENSKENDSSVEETAESAEENLDQTEEAGSNEVVDDARKTDEQLNEQNEGENVEKEADVEGSDSSSVETTEDQTSNAHSETSNLPISEEITNDVKETESSEQPSENPVDVSAETPATSNEDHNEPAKEEPGSEESEKATEEEEEEESPEQEDLTLRIEIPDKLRSRNHIFEVLRLDSGSVDIEAKLYKAEETTLKDLKRLYEAAIKPLEILYKYRDLSNRHFGDPEIFSKPLILFMGPWSGGKSTIINYLMDNEYKTTALRTGAEPSPAYFNIVMWGEREEILDGTQLAADWTFSGLQKFGQGLLDRLRGLKMNHPLLEKVNIVEIPGILEIRKQVERLFPLNDACQWFIDRADIIFLVYDPSKLDVGPETEAILDQLKGREYQTKIILNKADQVKPEELMRVQGTLIWNISPLMSSTEPPVMYSTSLWSHPYQTGSPSRLLFAQEKAFLKDLREAVDKRVENKISSARRFAVRVRNHAKMVDCYLTTYYNHKTFFGNKQTVSNDIIEHPQNYHIYEGLSTLTNISRYDLPDPDVYRDFFRLNPVYDFQQLSSTCTYFRGCPINRLDVAIAYDLPELVGKYKKIAEDITKSTKSKEKK